MAKRRTKKERIEAQKRQVKQLMQKDEKLVGSIMKKNSAISVFSNKAAKLMRTPNSAIIDQTAFYDAQAIKKDLRKTLLITALVLLILLLLSLHYT